ncbi:MAG: amidohydrolase [Acidobacteriota bacterium]
MNPFRTFLLTLTLTATLSCASDFPAASGDRGSLLLTNGRIYSFAWPEPELDGTPSAEAPQAEGRWQPDAEAMLLRNGRIEWLGSSSEAESRRAEASRVVDLGGAVVLPGLVDAHTHVRGLGANLRRVDLVGVETEDEVLERLRSQRPDVPAGKWIVGWGWDDGAWATRYPTWDRLSAAYPDNPVVLLSLHSFALWANRAAFAAAGIDAETEAPVGGEILRTADGELTGLLLNRATPLIVDAVPPPSRDELREEVRAGLEEMARSGYVSVHEAGLDRETLAAFRELEERGELPVRVYAMLSGRDRDLMEEWIARGPDCAPQSMLRVCAVKAFWDGALGSRGARLLEDYADRPGHRGVSGEGYGFDLELVGRSIGAGFQVGVHAIGDAGNRETLEFFTRALDEYPAARERRHRVEHAQVVHPDDRARFADLGLVASMQPPHLAEDQAWAAARLGPLRARGAYAWRSLRQAGAELVFGSDLAGSDHDLFYGLHSAVTRRPRTRRTGEGWHPEEALTVEETIRAYSSWAAYAAFLEGESGVLAPGRFADLTVVDVDPFALGAERAGELFEGRILLTVVGGQVVFEAD